MSDYRQFIFESYVFDRDQRQLNLNYSYDGELHFTETLEFDFEFTPDFSPQLLENALVGLWLIAGISYYKAYLAPEMVIRGHQLTPDQAAFFTKLYRLGLGEFWVVNQLSPDRLAPFPSDAAATAEPVGAPNLEGLILPLGGGKDSLTSAYLLKQHGREFATWTLNHREWLGDQIDRIGAPHLHVERTISPALIKANQSGAFNGHIPFSAYLAFTAVVTAILTGRRDIAVSNEASAGEANLDYRGIAVNHQYSKTLEFEGDFQNYVAAHISSDIRYFSLLRPLSELRIAELFTVGPLKEFAGSFSSCNRNFRQGSSRALYWCGECPKCAFVFLILAPFVPRDRLIKLFGKNLFTDPKLKPTYMELLGLQGHKPFECVGEVRESRQAVSLARQTGAWPELEQYTFPPLEYNWRSHREHLMPEEYVGLLP